MILLFNLFPCQAGRECGSKNLGQAAPPLRNPDCATVKDLNFNGTITFLAIR